MLSKLTDDEVQSRRSSKNYQEYEELDKFLELDDDSIEESGITFLDKDNNVTGMYRSESYDDTINTMKKVVAVCDLGEDEIKKFDKVRHIVKGFLEICFRKKFTVFALSMAFIFMFFMGIKERVYAICLMYTWGFFTITETGKALKFVRETIEEYKIREEALLDKEVMGLLDKVMNDDTDDMRIYSLKKRLDK